MGLNIEDIRKLEKIKEEMIFNQKLDRQKLIEGISLVEKTNNLEEMQLILDAYQNSAKNLNFKNSITAKTISLLTLELRKTQEITQVIWNIVDEKYSHLLDLKKIRAAWILKISEEQKSLELFKNLLRHQIDKLPDKSTAELLEIATDELCENSESNAKNIPANKKIMKFKLLDNLLKIMSKINSKKIFKRTEIDEELRKPLLKYIDGEIESQNVPNKNQRKLEIIKEKIKRIFSNKRLSENINLQSTGNSIEEIVSQEVSSEMTNEEFAKQMKEIADSEANQKMQQLQKELDEMYTKVMEIWESKEEINLNDIADQQDKQKKSKKSSKLVSMAKKELKKILHSISLFAAKERKDFEFVKKDTEYLSEQHDSLVNEFKDQSSIGYFDVLKSIVGNILKKKNKHSEGNYVSEVLMSGRLHPVINNEKKNKNLIKLLKTRIDRSIKNGREFYNLQLKKLNRLKKFLSKTGKNSYSGINKTIRSIQTKLSASKTYYNKVYSYGKLLANQVDKLLQLRTSFGGKNNIPKNSKSILNSRGNLFNPKRCKNFFNKGEVSKFFKDHNIQYKHEYNRIISKLQPADVIGNIQSNGINIAEIRGNKLLLSEVDHANKYLQEDLFTMILKNISDPINPPIVNLEGKVNQQLLIKLCKAEDFPQVFFKINNIKNKFPEEFLSIIKDHNDKITGQKFSPNKNHANANNKSTLDEYSDHQLNFSHKFSGSQKNSNDVNDGYHYRNRF